MKKLTTILAFALLTTSNIANAGNSLTRMIDVNISRNGDTIMSEMVKSFDKVPLSLEKIGSDGDLRNQYSLLITAEVQENGLIRTEVYTKIINHSGNDTIVTAPQDVAKTFLLTAEKPAQYKIGPYWVKLVIKGDMVASASDVLSASN